MVNRSIIFSFIVFSMLKADVLPLTQRYFHNEDMGHSYARGTYMIILSDASLETFLTDDNTGNFVEFKKFSKQKRIFEFVYSSNKKYKL